MSRSEDSQRGSAAAGLRAVESFWQARLPESFVTLYAQFPYPFLAPCEFFPLDAIYNGAGRGFGMVPQFAPFGRSVGEGGLYGFYLTPEASPGFWPVLYWDEDEMFLHPVASDFDAFLRHCVLVGRYETEEPWEDTDMPAQDDSERQELARLLHLPDDILFGPVPRSDSELYERLVLADPQDAFSLCHIGCGRRARGDSERALDFFHRASEGVQIFALSSRQIVGSQQRLRQRFAGIRVIGIIVDDHAPERL